jgi:hypothetical protein
VRHVSRTGAIIRELVPSMVDSVHETSSTRLPQPTTSPQFPRSSRRQMRRNVGLPPVRDAGAFRRQFTNLEQAWPRQHTRKTRFSLPADSRKTAHRQPPQSPGTSNRPPEHRPSVALPTEKFSTGAFLVVPQGRPRSSGAIPLNRIHQISRPKHVIWTGPGSTNVALAYHSF